jgi:2-hydroxychromene-2-carboxylate isomerase
MRAMAQPRATFYFDLGSPYAYLSAERIDALIGERVRWQPILLGGLFKLNGRSSWALGDHDRRQRGMADVERRALAYGLAPIRWPDPWPTNYLAAMRALTYAFTIGAGRELAILAFRAAFQAGVDLSLPAGLLDAGEQAGLERGRLQRAIGDPEIKRALREATDAAHARGVIGVPTIAVGEALLWGDDRLQEAAALAAGGSTQG